MVHEGNSSKDLEFQVSKGNICILADSPAVLKHQICKNMLDLPSDAEKVTALHLINPCGETVSYERVEDIPNVSVPCACGNPEHWFIKYKN